MLPCLLCFETEGYSNVSAMTGKCLKPLGRYPHDTNFLPADVNRRRQHSAFDSTCKAYQQTEQRWGTGTLSLDSRSGLLPGLV